MYFIMQLDIAPRMPVSDSSGAHAGTASSPSGLAPRYPEMSDPYTPPCPRQCSRPPPAITALGPGGLNLLSCRPRRIRPSAIAASRPARRTMARPTIGPICCPHSSCSSWPRTSRTPSRRACWGDACVFDLSQNPARSRPRSGLLPFRRAGGRYWSHARSRWMLPRERAAAMGYAVYPELGGVAAVPQDSAATQAPAFTFGNAMHVANVGCVLVCALLAMAPIRP